MSDKIKKTDKDWKKILTPEEYKITREKGTEMAFTGKYYKNNEAGMYLCKCCEAELFSSKTKYDSGSGWPSFYEPENKNNITEIKDFSHGMIRIEVVCKNCDAHLGHVFKDGPEPTGLRYCINSESLNFKNEEKS